MSIGLKSMGGQKILANLEDLTRKLANELNINLADNSGVSYPVDMSGTNETYCLSYHNEEPDADGIKYECVIVEKTNAAGERISITHSKNYLFNLDLPLDRATAYKDKMNSNPDSTNKIDQKFMANAVQQLEQQLNGYKLKPAKNGASAFISCGVKFEEEELDQVTTGLIRKYLD